MEVDEGIVTTEGDEKQVEERRLSVVATFGILIATIAAAVAGSLAALASVHGDDARAQSVSWATYSNELLLATNQYIAISNDSANARIEDAWRVQLLEDQAGATTDPVLRAELDSDAAQAIGKSEVPATASPTFPSPSPTQWCRGLKALQDDCAYEVANAYGVSSLRDDQQERAYIACVSMLAIALFLFALSKMLSQPSMEKMFLGLGALITLIAIGWMAVEPLVTPAVSPSESAIRSYESGWRLEQQGKSPAKVVAYLTRATSEDPSLADGWQQLGEEELFQQVGGSQRARCQMAIGAFAQAWDVRGAAEDNDRLAVAEALCGEHSAALATLRQAPSHSSDVLRGPALALAELASGHWHQASQALSEAVGVMESQGDGARGPVYSTYWFDQLLTEVRVLRAQSDPPAHLGDFVKRIERDEIRATLLTFGQKAKTPEPHASVNATATIATPQLGSAAEWVPVVLQVSYADLRNGDVITLNWDQSGTIESIRSVALDLPGTTVLVVGQPGGPRAGSGTFLVPTLDFVAAPGSYQVDVSLDKVPERGPPPLTVASPPPNFGPKPVPLTPVVHPKPTPTTTTTTTIAPPPTTTTTSCSEQTTTSTYPGEAPAVFCGAPSPS